MRSEKYCRQYHIFGKTVAEHDENLLALSLRLKERGLEASPNNCRFGVRKIKFFGVNYSKDDVAVHEDKVTFKHTRSSRRKRTTWFSRLSCLLFFTHTKINYACIYTLEFNS